MWRRWFVLPLCLSAIHTLFAVFFWIVNTTPEAGASWEYVFGAIDFAVYFTVGVPTFVAEVGVSQSGSWAYALWFSVSGAIQWFTFGLVVWLVKKRLMPDQRSGMREDTTRV